MKLFCALLLFLLLIAGPAAAITVGPAYVSGAAKSGVVVQPALTLAPKITIVTLPAGTAPVSPLLYIGSDPAGAAVSVNGVSKGKTPLTIGLYPGTYTVLITLAGYRDYTTSVTLQDGSKVAVDAQLQPALSAGALRQNISTVGTILPGLHFNRTIIPATIATPAPNTICVSGQSCLTDADAAALFGPGYAYKADEICGYAVTSDNQMIPKYCVSGNLGPNTSFNCLYGQHCLTLEEAGATLAPGWYYIEGNTCGWEGTAYSPVPKYCISGSPKGSGLQPGAIQSVAVANQITRIPVSSGTTSTTAPGVTKKPLGGMRQAGVIDSVLGFFSGLFSHPTCPAGQTACSGKCVDLQTDAMNCGSCDYTCFDPAVCSSGQCVAPNTEFPSNLGGNLT